MQCHSSKFGFKNIIYDIRPYKLSVYDNPPHGPCARTLAHLMIRIMTDSDATSPRLSSCFTTAYRTTSYPPSIHILSPFRAALPLPPLPPVPTTHADYVPGLSETILGAYLSSRPGLRRKLVIATKIIGHQPCSIVAANRQVSTIPLADRMPYPTATLDAANVLSACDASLRRLQTSYIDLYQLHWPDRYVPRLGARAYNPPSSSSAATTRTPPTVPIRDTLLAIKRLLAAGKIRAYGLSNETTFGLCEFCRVAEELGMPRPASIQNSFSLLDRAFEADLAEACAPRNWNVALLPWSPLAGGTLTGKYAAWERGVNDERVGVGCRFVRFRDYMKRFQTRKALDAATVYGRIAEEVGLTGAGLALQFVASRWFVGAVVVGATSVAQLEENIDACEREEEGEEGEGGNRRLGVEVLRRIDRVHNANKDVALSY